jgi:hypothetical protein
MSILLEHLDYSMQPGQGIRVKECDNCIGQGNSKAVQITRKEDGFLCYCFRCNKTRWFPDSGASESQVKSMVEAVGKHKKTNRPKVVTLPEDYTTALPPKAAVQLYNMELDPDDIQEHDIGWSPGHKRIIVPVYKWIAQSNRPTAAPGRNTIVLAKKLVGVMGRKLDDDDSDKPKWWTQRQEDIKHPRFVIPAKTLADCRKVIIVENCFSAIKCSKATGWFSIALLTSYLPYELYRPLQRYEVHLWLDQDAYGKACKYQAELGNRGITAHTHVTKLKPKNYPLDDIPAELGVDTV